MSTIHEPGGYLLHGHGELYNYLVCGLPASTASRWILATRDWERSVNAFNTPQFAEPGAELSSPNFGQITNMLNDGRTFRVGVLVGAPASLPCCSTEG